MSWIVPTLEHGEGEALRRAVLVRNAMTVTFLAKVRAAHAARLAASRVLVGSFKSHAPSSTTSKSVDIPNTNGVKTSGTTSADWPPSTNSWPSTEELEESRRAAARLSPVRSTYKFKTKEDEERWTLMVNRGFHPADRVEPKEENKVEEEVEEQEEGGEDRIILQRPSSARANHEEVEQVAKIEVYDYASDESVCSSSSSDFGDDDNNGFAPVEKVQEEKVWFDGLLQEVSTDRKPLSASALEDEQGGRSAIYYTSSSSTPSLPSLIVDDEEDDDDDDEDDSADDADDEEDDEDEENGQHVELTTAQKYLKPIAGLDPFSPNSPSYLYCYSSTVSATDELP